MNWLPISTSTRTAPEFIGSEPVQRATWLCLMLYCAEHETGGVIRDCSSWGDRRWMQTIGSTKAEVLSDCALFRFVGGDLAVWGYDPDYECIVRDKRIIGQRGGMASAASRKRKKKDECSNHTLNHTVQRIGVEGSGEDRNGVEEEAATSASLGQSSKFPSLEEVKVQAIVIGMPEKDAVEFHEYWMSVDWLDKSGHPVRNWKAKLSARNKHNAERNAENENSRRSPARHSDPAGKRPATYLPSPEGKYGPENCGF